MPFSRKRPPARRRANLRIDYPFDRVGYVRWRLRCWGVNRLDSASRLYARVAASVRGAAGGARRRAQREGTIAERRGRAWLGERPVVLTPEAAPE